VEDLRILHDVGDRVDGRRQDVPGHEPLHQLGPAEIAATRLDERVEFVFVRLAGVDGREALVRHPVAAQRLAEFDEEFLGRAGDRHPAVLARVEARRREVEASVSRPGRVDLGIRPGPDGVAHGVGQGIEERHVDALSLPGLAPGNQRGQHPGADEFRSHDVDQGNRETHLGLTRMTVLGKQARVALGEKVDAGTPRVGAVGAEGRDADPDQVFAKRLHGLVAETELLQGRRPDIGDHDVGTRHQATEHFAGAVAAVHVQHQGPLVAVQAHEGRALAVPAGAQVAAIVPEERFDLDDVGAQVAQQRGRVGAREHGGHVEDTNAFERTVAGGGTHRSNPSLNSVAPGRGGRMP